MMGHLDLVSEEAHVVARAHASDYRPVQES